MKTFRYIAYLCISLGLFGCGKGGSATIGRYGVQANFPMYFLTNAGGVGTIYAVTDITPEGDATADQIATGLASPAGLTVDLGGQIYLAEEKAAPDGRVVRVSSEGTATAIMTGLDYPTGVAVDSFNQIYVVENGLHRIQKLDNSGKLTDLTAEALSSPEKGFFDDNDNLFLVEATDSVLSKISPSGGREVLTTSIAGLRDATVDRRGHLHVLTVDPSTTEGTVSLVESDGTLRTEITGLSNPIALTFDNENALYIAEGYPSNRILRNAQGSKTLKTIIETTEEPLAIAFAPF